MAKEEEQFIDAEEYWQDDKADYRVEVLRQIRKCVDGGSKDLMRRGVTKEMIGGKPVYVSGEDLRSTYINSVRQLKIMLKHYFDKKIEDNLKKLNEDYEKDISDMAKHYRINSRYWDIQENHPAWRIKIEKTLDLSHKMEEELILLFKRKNDLRAATLQE